MKLNCVFRNRPLLVDDPPRSLALVPWRLNLLAYSQDLLFVAVGNTIHVLDAHRLHRPSIHSVRILAHPDPKEQVSDEATAPSPAPINCLYAGYLGTEPVLVAVDDAGQIVYVGCEETIWFTTSLDSRQPIVLSVGSSTWCIALHAEKYLLAVGTNHHDVVLFRLAEDVSLQKGRPQVSTQAILTSTRQILQGHEHNVPSVDFNSDGTLVASCSVDGCYRIWRVDDGTCIRTESICARGSDDPSHWGWCVRTMDDREIPFSSLINIHTSSGNQEALSYLTDMFQTHDVIFDDEYENYDVEISDYDEEGISIDDSERDIDYGDVDSDQDDQYDDQDDNHDDDDDDAILVENPYTEINDRALEDDDWYSGAYFQERAQRSHSEDMEFEGDDAVPVTMPDLFTTTPLPAGVHVPGAWPEEEGEMEDQASMQGDEKEDAHQQEEPATTLEPAPPPALVLDHTPILLCTTRSNVYLFDPFGRTDAIHKSRYVRHGYSRLAAAGQISHNLGYLLESSVEATSPATMSTTSNITTTTTTSHLDQVELPDVIPPVRDRRQQLLERVTRGMFALRQAPIRRLAFAQVLRHSGLLQQQFPGIIVMADQSGQALLLQVCKTSRHGALQYRLCPTHWMPETPPEEMIFGICCEPVLGPSAELCHWRIYFLGGRGTLSCYELFADSPMETNVDITI